MNNLIIDLLTRDYIEDVIPPKVDDMGDYRFYIHKRRATATDPKAQVKEGMIANPLRGKKHRWLHYELPIKTTFAPPNNEYKAVVEENLDTGHCKIISQHPDEKFATLINPTPTSFETAVENKLAELINAGQVLQVLDKQLDETTKTVMITAVVPDGSGQSKEVMRLAKWNEQANTWELRNHTK